MALSHIFASFLVVANLVVVQSAPSYRQPGVSYTTVNGRPQCTVYAHLNQTNDVPNLLKAFGACGNGGDIIFPEGQNYWIAERLNPVLNDVSIDWRGQFALSDNLTYWRANSYPIAYQNHAAGFVITGDNIRIDGHGTGGINGNGNAWYSVEKTITQPGRPMSMVFWNVSDVTLTSFFIKDSPLWGLNIMNGTNMDISDISVNATATGAAYGVNWVQNTDGFDTQDSSNIRLRNFVYQGGDDCIALKSQSRNIDIHNVTCNGGNGIAIGSTGQYLIDSSIWNIVVDTVKLVRINNDLHYSAYIKTWVGVLTAQNPAANGYYESGDLPRGGGWGSVRNILFSNFDVGGASAGPLIYQDNGNNGTATKGTSLVEVSNVVFENFTGTIGSTSGASLQCSSVYPCYNIEFKNIDLLKGKNLTGSCSNAVAGSVHGLSGSGCS